MSQKTETLNPVELMENVSREENKLRANHCNL